MGACKFSEISMVCFVICELQRLLGLVNGSMNALYNGSHITCSYSRLITMQTRRNDTILVKNLSKPYYILLAQGPTNDRGNAQLIVVMWSHSVTLFFCIACNVYYHYPTGEVTSASLIITPVQ